MKQKNMTSSQKISIMSKKRNKIMFKGNYLGFTVLILIQFIVGIVHIFFGLIMLLDVSYLMTPLIYNFYTFFYGIFTLIFTYLLWKCNRLGWIGTILVSLFVILVDSLTALNLLTILGIPKIAAIGEIPYSIIIIAYLLQNHVRTKYYSNSN